MQSNAVSCKQCKRISAHSAQKRIQGSRNSKCFSRKQDEYRCRRYSSVSAEISLKRTSAPLILCWPGTRVVRSVDFCRKSSVSRAELAGRSSCASICSKLDLAMQTHKPFLNNYKARCRESAIKLRQGKAELPAHLV